MSNPGSKSIARRDRQRQQKRREDGSEQLHKASWAIMCEGWQSPTSAWDALLRPLKSNEPCVRHLSLKCIESCLSLGAGDSMMSQAMRRDMCDVVTDVVCNDVEERTRSAACIVLSRITWCSGAAPPSLTKHIFHVCLRHLQDLQQHASLLTAHRPTYNQARSNAIQALDTILQSRFDLTPPLFSLVSCEVFQILTESKENREHDLIRAQVIFLLANLPGTLRNRQRSQQFWPVLRPIIARSIKWISNDNTDNALVLALSRFVSQWYGLVPDAILDRFPLYDQLSGYSELQYSFLMNRDKEGTASARNRLREDSGPADYLGVVDKDDVLAFVKRYSRRAQIVDILPEKFDLTFQAVNILNSELFFDAPNCKRTLNLTNRSSKQTHRFTIQICPTRHFSIYPAFGEIGPHSSIPITIKFERIAPLEKAVSHGYVRLRSWTGFAFERLPISFYNGPFLQILNGYIDFGACPLGRRLKRCLYVKNIGIAPMTCFIDLCLPGGSLHGSSFEFAPKTASIAPGSIAIFDVYFKAQTQHAIEVQMLLTCPAQQHPVILTGSGAFPIVVTESLLNMGPCMPEQRIDTPLNLTNVAPYTILVQFDSNIRGLSIPATAIPSGLTRTIIATWDNQGHYGYIEDLVYIRVRECAQIPIRFCAFVGPILTSPVQSPLRMPFVSVHMILQSAIPIQNHSPYDAEFVIDGLEGTPFYILPTDGPRLNRDKRAFATESANTPAPSMLREHISESRDRHHTVKAHSTLFLVVLFSSHKPGFFERDFNLTVLAPRVARWPPFQLRAVAILDNEKFPLKKLLLFFGEPGVFKCSELTRLPSKDFEGDIESRLIFGDTWEGISARSETFAFGSFEEWSWCGRALNPITVENLSSRPHNFSLMLTYPIFGTSSRHGICGAFDKMIIPCEMAADHHMPSPIDCFVVIRDNFAKTSICWIRQLATHLIEVAAHQQGRKLAFTQVDVETISQLPLTVTNRSGLRVPFRIQIEYDFVGETTAQFWCDQMDHVLDRWEQRTVWIQFRSDCAGHFVGRLQLVYAEPSRASDAASSNDAQDYSFVSFFSELVAECGLPAVTIDCGLIDFGHSGVGLPSFHNMQISNSSHQQELIFLIVEPPFSVVNSTDTAVILAPMSSSNIALAFNPVTSGRFYSRLQLLCGDWFQDVMLFGEGGVMSLTSSMGPAQFGPNIASESDRHEIAMGTVRVCAESTRTFRLINNGTIDMEIVDIVSSVDDGLTYTIAMSDAVDVKELPKFGQESLDAPMIDWDEVAYQKVYVDIASTSVSKRGVAAATVSFPYRISPGAQLPLQLSFSRYLTGIFKPILRVETRQSANKIDTFVFSMKFNVHDIMEINESHLDFGTIPFLQTCQLPLTFQNECLQPISWRLEITNVSAVRTVDKVKVPVRNDIFTASPPSGTLPGSGQQQILLTFSSSTVHCCCKGTAVLRTSDIGSSTVEMFACSGAPLLTTAETTLTFGCINLGSSKSKVLILNNEGELPATFVVKLTLSKRFHVVPMRGVVQARSRQPLWIKFAPIDSEQVATQLRIDWGDSERISNRITIEMSGSGGKSEILVKQSCVDFGLAMLCADTVKVLRVYNEGAAEALLRIDLPDPALTVAGAFFVESNSHRDLDIVFHPMLAAAISGHASIYSQETGAASNARIQVQIKGRVGVPSLELGPPDLIGLYTLNMGVCVVRRLTQRQFYIENSGNMDVPFEIRIYRLSQPPCRDHIEIATSAVSGSQIVQSWLPQLQPQDREWVAVLKTMVVVEPERFTIEPRSGVFTQGQRTLFTASFTPVVSDEFLDVAVSIVNPSALITLIATALSDEPALELDMAERVLDFGICRCANTFRRKFRILNKGSIPYQYHIGPDMREPQWNSYRNDYDAARLAWTVHMKSIGFSFQYSGACPRRSHDTITVQFTAQSAGQFAARARIVCSGGYEQIELRALGGISQLELSRLDDGPKLKAANGDVIDFGLRPIGQVSQATVVLHNSGMLATGFMVSRAMPDQFDVYPLSGRIESGVDVPIWVTFRPSNFGLCQFDLKIKGVDNTVDSWRIVGRGGQGNLQVHYLHTTDQRLKGLDFGTVNLGYMVEKSLVVYNDGEVALNLWAECDQAVFAIRQTGQCRPYKSVSELDTLVRTQGLYRPVTHVIKPENKFSDALLFAQSRSIDVMIGPKHFVVASVFVAAATPGKYNGTLVLASQFNTMTIAMRAESGTVVLSHNGDLQFGSVGVDHIYEKEISLVNNGSITTSAHLYWEVPHVIGQKSSTLALSGPNISFYGKLWGQTARLVIRIIRAAKAMSSKAAREGLVIGAQADPNQVRRKKMAEIVEPLMMQLQNVRLTQAEHDANIRHVEQFLAPTHPLFETTVGLTNMGNETSRRLTLLQNTIKKRVVQDSVESPLGLLLQIIGPNLNNIRGVSQISSASFGLNTNQARSHSRTASSGSVPSPKTSFLAVEPSRINLDIDVPVSVKITASFPALTTFIGSLVAETDLVGCAPYAIRMSASPMNAKMVISDGSLMKFGRISLGSTEVQMRSIANTGSLPIRFTIRHRNFGLTVNPSSGYLEADDSIELTFTFRPVDEESQTSPVLIETDSTDTVEFEFSGAGGVPKLHLASFDRYDFGRCMAGRTSKKAIRIYNIGNAQLPILRCLLDQTVIFTKGGDWPNAKFTIDPDSFYDLNVEFTPQSENVFRGRVVIETETRVLPIELIGTGREVLLTYQTQNVDLSNTIVGNHYRRDILLNNVSDLEYPLRISVLCAAIPELIQDLALELTDLTLQPFEQRKIYFLYKPTRVVDTVALIHLSSIYSENDIPIPVTTGTAVVSIDNDVVDFEQFQKGHHCSSSVIIRNSGTVAVAFRLHSSRDPEQLDFTVSRWQGVLVPDRDVEIIFKTKLSQLGRFEDELCLETQIDGKRHYIRVKGQCDMPIVDPAKFHRVDFGDCLAGETATQSFVIENTGGFPLTYKMKVTFPIKVMPNQGAVQALCRQRFSVQWVPSGGYGLRSTLKVHTNLGVFDVKIKGRGAYPRFTISSAFLDFGTGALHHIYEQKFKIINRGKVGIRFVIPYSSSSDESGLVSGSGAGLVSGSGEPAAERHGDEVRPGFTASPMQGSLAAGESAVVKVNFEPREYRKYSDTIVIESKGRYREVAVIGTGAALRLDVPARLELGSCPVGYYCQFPMTIVNSGDVPVTLRPTSVDLPSDFVLSYHPQTLTLTSMVKLAMNIGLKVGAEFSGPFSFVIVLVANESTWRIPISGFALTLQNAFSHLACLLMAADVSLLNSPVSLQQWPNALDQDLLHMRSDRQSFLRQSVESDERTVESVLKLIVEAVSEMSKAADSSLARLQFSQYLTDHLETGVVPVEGEYDDKDDLAALVLSYEPNIRKPNISSIVNLVGPEINDNTISTITASPPLFLPELTIL